MLVRSTRYTMAITEKEQKYINLLYFLQHVTDSSEEEYREKEGGRSHWKGKIK